MKKLKEEMEGVVKELAENNLFLERWIFTFIWISIALYTIQKQEHNIVNVTKFIRYITNSISALKDGGVSIQINSVQKQ